MKDLIVIIGTVLLGCLLFQWIAGEGMSLKTAAGEQMQSMIEQYQR